VVIVSHSVFINFFTVHMVHPEKMGFLRAARLFIRILKLRNSSITHASYHKPTNPKKTGWRLMHRK